MSDNVSLRNQQVMRGEHDEAKKVAPSVARGRMAGNRGARQGGEMMKQVFTGECEELSNCIFDVQQHRKGTFEENQERLATYAGSHYEFGRMMRNLVTKLQRPGFTSPSPPPDFAGRGEQKTWEIEYSQYMKNKSKLESDIHKLYATIWGQCTDAMKAKLKAIPNYDTMDDNLDAVELLKGIKGLSYRFESSQYEFQSMADSTARLYRFFQARTMTNTEYYERFNNLLAVIEHYGGELECHTNLIKQELERARLNWLNCRQMANM